MGSCCSDQANHAPLVSTDGGDSIKQVTSKSSMTQRESVEEKMDDARYTDVDVLLTIPFFDDLDRKHLKELRSLFAREIIKSGQIVCEEGKNANIFHVIVSGHVCLSCNTPNGDFELALLSKGEWFGETSLVNDSIQAVTARAVEDSVILTLTMQQYEEAIIKHPELSVSVSTFGRVPPLKVQLKQIPFFADVPEFKLQQLGTMVEFKKCQAGQVICRQGDDADGFYYLVDGRVNVSAVGSDGQSVHLDTLVAGNWFGEIALLEHTSRTATITSTQSCLLMYLNRERFNRFLKLAPEVKESGMFQRLVLKRTANSLKAIPLFSTFRRKELGPLQQFDEKKLALLGELFRFVQYQDGHKIFTEGDVGDAFFIILSGVCLLTASDPKDSTVNLGELGANEWFGEAALLEKTKRNCTVIAKGNVVMLRLAQENFQSFLRLAPEIETIFRARAMIRTATRLKEIPFFSGIKENKPWSKLDLLAGLFRFEEFEDGKVICEEGQKGDRFYIIVEGICTVSVSRPNKPDVIIDRLQKDSWFGEIALMQDTPRTANITCEGPVVVVSLGGDKFRSFLNICPELTEPFRALVSHRTANVLRTIDLFKTVKENKPWNKLELLGTLFYYEQCAAGDIIFHYGDVATKFYLIIRGSVRITGPDAEGKEVDLGTVTVQQHFGEIALLRNRPHNTTATALEPCVFLCLTKQSFFQFMKVAPELQPYFQNIVDTRRQSFVLEPEKIQLDFREESISNWHLDRNSDAGDEKD